MQELLLVRKFIIIAIAASMNMMCLVIYPALVSLAMTFVRTQFARHVYMRSETECNLESSYKP